MLSYLFDYRQMLNIDRNVPLVIQILGGLKLIFEATRDRIAILVILKKNINNKFSWRRSSISIII